MSLLAWATDPVLRRNGSSGGFIRAMVSYLLASKKIDEVVLTHTGAEGSDFHPEAIVTRDAAEILSERSTSVYYPVNPFAVTLDPEAIYAITLLPCQVEILREKQARGHWLNVRYVFELLCAYVPTAAWTTKLCNDFQVPNPRRIVYRQGVWPGYFNVDGQTEKLSVVWEQSAAGYKSKRCLGCTRLGGKSDWLCADPWGLTCREVGDGKTLVAMNTREAAKLTSAASLTGYMQIESDSGLMQQRLKKHRS